MLPLVEAPRLSLDAVHTLCDLVRPQRIPWSPSSGTNRTEVGDDGKSSTANQQLRQLDLLVPAKDAVGRQRLTLEIRKEVTKLLKLLLGECIASTVETKEASDE